MNVKTDLEAILECNTRARNDVTFAKSRVAAAGCEQSAMALRILVEATNALANQKRLIKEALESLKNQISPSEELLSAAPECNGLENAGLDKTNAGSFDTLVGRFRNTAMELLSNYEETDEGYTKRKYKETLEDDLWVLRIRISLESKD